jgi:cytochrome c-type biogenesis protein CcmH
MRRWWLALFLAFAASAAAAAVPQSSPIADARPPVFRDAAEEKRFRMLTEQLRCVMCQNQSLADSNALIAQDLRREVLGLIRAGKSEEEIKQFLGARYTEFVLYQPRVGPSTWLLWFGPLLLLGIGAAVVASIVRKHGRGAPPAAPENDSQEW